MDMGKPTFRGDKTRIKEKSMKIMKYEAIGDRPFIKVPVFDERLDACPLDARGGLVYGYLMYLARVGDGSSRTKIATSLRMEKSAVDRAVAVLIAGGAVVDEGRTVKAVEPTGASQGWFRYIEDPTGEQWYERFVYDRVYLPRSYTTISIKTNALYWHLVKLGFPVEGMPGYLQVGGDPKSHPQYLTIEYLAKGIRVYRKTVARSLKTLRELDLVRVQFKSRKRFVCGLPPIGTNTSLWRESWGGGKQAEVEVTAESLFGLPSSDVLKPDTHHKAGGAGRLIRMYHIRGKVAEEIVTKIVKHRIERKDWQPLLGRAYLDHQANLEKKPGRYRSDHCGFLFKHMLDEFMKGEELRRIRAGERSYIGHAEMEARPMLQTLRLTKDMTVLLNYALNSEELKLRGGESIPCRLNWESVLEVLKEVKGDFEAFKVGIAKSISFSMKTDPQCDWFDAWMGMEQMPRFDDSPMIALGLDSRSRGLLRTHVEMIAKRKIDVEDAVAYRHLVNNLIRLGCWQATDRRRSTVESSIEEVSRVLFTDGEGEEEFSDTACESNYWLRNLEGVSIW
jgi:predicted transcriptional regulator